MAAPCAQITDTDSQPEVELLSLAVVPELHDVEVYIQVGHGVLHGIAVLESVHLGLQGRRIGLSCRRIFYLIILVRCGREHALVCRPEHVVL